MKFLLSLRRPRQAPLVAAGIAALLALGVSVGIVAGDDGREVEVIAAPPIAEQSAAPPAEVEPCAVGAAENAGSAATSVAMPSEFAGFFDECEEPAYVP